MSISTCDPKKPIADPVNLCNFFLCRLALLNMVNTTNLSIALQSEPFSEYLLRHLHKKP